MSTLAARLWLWSSSPVGEGDGARPGWAANLEAFRLFLIVHVGARSLLKLSSFDEAPVLATVQAATTAVALVGLLPHAAQRVVPLLCALVASQLLAAIAIGYDTANHVFLEFVFLLCCSVCRADDADERALLLPTLRLLVAPFLFYTGFQKVVYGFYFDGQFLAYMAATSDFFHAPFQLVIPESELARLRDFNGPAIGNGRYTPALGAGPYRVDAPLFVAMSNLVYVFEMAAGALLLVPRLRATVAWLTIGFVVAIEAGAREMTFGALMVALLLLFDDRPWLRRALPLLLGFYGYLLLAEHGGLGWLPMFRYRA